MTLKEVNGCKQDDLDQWMIIDRSYHVSHIFSAIECKKASDRDESSQQEENACGGY